MGAKHFTFGENASLSSQRAQVFELKQFIFASIAHSLRSLRSIISLLRQPP